MGDKVLFSVLMLVFSIYVVIGLCLESVIISVYRFNLFVFLLWPLFVISAFIKALIRLSTKQFKKDFIEAMNLLFGGK